MELKTSLFLLPLLCLLHGSASQNTPYLNAWEESKYIALDATNELLPRPELVQRISVAISIIRIQHPQTSQIKNNGRWFLGKLRLYEYDQRIFMKLQTSRYGPIMSASDGENGTTIVTFVKPFNPVVLAQRLESELGIHGDAVWKTGPDYGEIRYRTADNSYTFRQGLSSCGITSCEYILYSVFKIQNFVSNWLSEYAVDIPKEQPAPPSP